jgi:hypothetical protein
MKVNSIILAGAMMVSQAMFAQVAKGYQYLNDLRWVSAEKAFETSQEDEAKFYKGFAQFKQEEFDKAKTTFDANAASAFGMVGQGMMALQAGDIAKADASFENAAKTSKNKDPKEDLHPTPLEHLEYLDMIVPEISISDSTREWVAENNNNYNFKTRFPVNRL